MVQNGQDQKIYFFKLFENRKKTFFRANHNQKTRFFDPKLWISTKKSDILTFLGRKNHFLIIKYPRTNFLRPNSEYLLQKT